MIKNKAKGTKQKIQNEINLLEGKTDRGVYEKKDEAETLLKSFTDITNLYNSIINPENTTSSENQPDTNSKNIFGKIKDRIGSQWNEITRDNLKKKPVQTMLRAIGFAATGVGAAVLSYKGIKKLFGWGEDEEDVENEEDDEKKEKEEKKSIRKRIGSLILDYFEKNKK